MRIIINLYMYTIPRSEKKKYPATREFDNDRSDSENH